MNKNLFSINSNASIRDAANTMLDKSISSILVMKEEKYVGIVTHHNMSVKVVAQGLDPNETKVASIMEGPLIAWDASLPMNEALLSMKKNHVRHIVATVDGEVAGILSIQDFAHYHSQNIADPISTFWCNSEVLLDEGMFKYALDKLLSGMSDKLGSSSKTEKAIKEGEPISIIAQYAIDEGLNELAESLKLSTN